MLCGLCVWVCECVCVWYVIVSVYCVLCVHVVYMECVLCVRVCVVCECVCVICACVTNMSSLVLGTKSHETIA